ncbi:MAG TPA: NmrA family NAD(P)-binding protein [Candidatus Sericytochromatia bacterium]
MTETILVMGATGNVGSQVVKQLADAGANVRAAVRSPRKAESLKSEKVSLTEFDTDKPETVEAAFQGVDKVFLLTPLVPNMVELSANLVEAAKKAGVKHIIKSSGMGAEVEPGITLTRWHREAEKAIEASGIAFTFVRPNGFMQNYKLFRKLQAEKLTMLMFQKF